MLTYENEIEWLDTFQDELNDFRESCFKEETFKAYVAEHGAKRCLYLATSLHREVADQLKLQNENNVIEEFASWRSKAVRVAGSMKKYRQVLRRMVRELHGSDAVDEINDLVLDEAEDLV